MQCLIRHKAIRGNKLYSSSNIFLALVFLNKSQNTLNLLLSSFRNGGNVSFHNNLKRYHLVFTIQTIHFNCNHLRFTICMWLIHRFNLYIGEKLDLKP